MKTFTRLLSFLRAYRLRLLAAGLCSMCVAGLTAAYAWLARPVLDGIFIEQDQFLLVALPLILLGVALAKGLFAYGQAYLMSYVGNRIVADVRQQLFRQLVRLPVRFHDAHPSGGLVSRVMNDVNQMANAVPSVLKDLLQQGLTFLAMVGVVFYQHWQLALILTAVLPISSHATVRIGWRLRRLATRGQESMGEMASVLKEAFSGIRVVKAFGCEDMEGQRFASTNTRYLEANLKVGQLAALASPLMEMIGVCGVAMIIWYGGYLVFQGDMTPGAFFSFLTAMFMAYAPIRRLSGANAAIQSAIAAAERVFAVLDLEHEQVGQSGQPVLPRIARCVEFQNVSFRYTGAKDWALLNIDLMVEAGEVVALVGKSGSGKTTLVSLVPRFYDPTNGMVLIDGQDIRQMSLASLRSQVAIVSQDTMLFDETVRQNILYGRLDATQEEIVEAAKAAHAFEFIQKLPMGLETQIGENGLKLSGGERQRLAIARAILRDPPILILDEATSSLDSDSERMVQQALANLMKSRTTLVIAHRLSTVEHADRIVTLSRGRLTETGTHAELLRRGGPYAKLYHTQFRQPLREPLTSPHA